MSITFPLVPGLIVILLASVLRGFSGFGFSLAAVPFLSIIFGLRVTIPLVLCLEFLNVLPLAARLLPAVDKRLFSILTIGAVVALPLGLAALTMAPAKQIEPLVSLLVLISVAAIWRGPCGVRHLRRPLIALPTGMASGFLNGVAGMSGPPVILFMLGGPTSPETARATMLAFFPISALFTVGLGLASQVYDVPPLWLLAAALPVSILGTEIGLRLGLITPAPTVRRLSLSLLAFSAVASLAGHLFWQP